MSATTNLTPERFERLLRRDNVDERTALVRFLGIVETLVDLPGATDAERLAQIRDALAAADKVLAEAWEAAR